MGDVMCWKCRGRKAQPRKVNRGLCWSCYRASIAREPTEEELEATIAYQSAHLPPWWWRECLKVAQEDRGLT
jgi:hypothetical protein